MRILSEALGKLLPVLCLVGLLDGCAKQAYHWPELDELIARSAVIYIAERDGTEYRITRILKAAPEQASAFVIGQKAELVVPVSQLNRKFPLIVFFEKKSVDPEKGTQLLQTELPFTGLEQYHISFDEFVAKVAKQR